jgi:hypothetical protein
MADARETQVVVRCTNAERDRFIALAAAADMTLSDLLRALLLWAELGGHAEETLRVFLNLSKR